MRARRAARWSAALAVGALVLFAAGPVAACQVPATATVACAADLQHWEATITLTNTSPVAFTLTSASLDVTAWATGSHLTGLTAGTRLDPGSQLTGRATGIPLTTAGALLSYAGRYADGREDSATFTLARPVPRCVEPTATTAPPTTMPPTTMPPTTMPSTTMPSTPAAPTSTPAATTTVPASVPGSVVTSVPSTAPPDVLGESATSTSVPTLPRTGAGSTLQLAVGAALLLIVGAGLVALALLGSPARSHHHDAR